MKRKSNGRSMNEIIGMVRENNCREAAFALEADTVKNAGAKEVSLLLFELIPLRSRAAKEMTVRLLEYGRPDLAQTDTRDNSLLKKIVKNERTDILNRIVEDLRKSDLRKNGLEEDWTMVLEYLLGHQQKVSVEKLLDLGILKVIQEDKRENICRKILMYKDMRMFKAILKYEKKLTAGMLTIPESTPEKQFLRLILNKYEKHIDLENGRDRLWKIAFACEADELMCTMLKKKKDHQYLSEIAGGTDGAFHVLDSVRPGKVLPEVRKEVLYRAFLSETGKQRYEYLQKKGWAKGESRKETISILEDVKEVQHGKRYDKSRYGQKERAEDRNKLNYLIRLEAGENENELSVNG